MSNLSPLGVVVGGGVIGITLGLLAYVVARIFNIDIPSALIIMPTAIIFWIVFVFIYWKEEIRRDK